MSFIRRVKSFSIKKYRSTDELKSTDHDHIDQNAHLIGGQGRLRRRTRNLNREKSLSMEFVPILRADIEKNELFIRQRNKLEEEDGINNNLKNEQFRRQRNKLEDRGGVNNSPKNSQIQCVQNARKKFRKNLEKRESRSLDETNFFHCIGGNSNEGTYSYSVQLRNDSNFGRTAKNRSRYNTVDVTNDLITEFNDETRHATNNSNKPGHFPVFDEDRDVQIRQSRKTERPKTFTPAVTGALSGDYLSHNKKKKEEPIDIKGPCRLEIGKEQCVKLRKNELLRLNHNGHLLILDESRNPKMTLKTNVHFKKGTKISKKDFEIVDTDKTIYRFHFETINNEVEKLLSIIVKDKTAFSITQFLKLLKKRSSRDLLESKGIIKNEPIFGNTLRELCDSSRPVPEVVTRIVELIEEPDNITSLGLYRASANLATVQRIRCAVDDGKWDMLNKYKKDVDVLTGTLKLFFRELKEPVVPYEIYQRLQTAIRNPSTGDNEIDKVINTLPEPNKATLIFIIKHLLKVCTHKSDNKMDFHNISICWGPSLFTFPDNCTDLVAQTTEFTRVTEDLLNYYNDILEKQVNTSPSFSRVVVPKDEPPKETDFVYEVVKTITELIESNLDAEGIYRKSGSNTRIDRIIKQLEMKHLNLDKSKNDIHDLCCVLKKFLSSLKEPLIPSEVFDRYCQVCDTLDDVALKHEVLRLVDNIPKKNVLLLLLEHLRNVIRHEKKNKMSSTVMTEIWMTTLANPSVQQHKKKMQTFSTFFQLLMNLADSVLPDLLPKSDSLVRIRESRYDNVPEDIRNEADIFNDKIDTKL